MHPLLVLISQIRAPMIPLSIIRANIPSKPTAAYSYHACAIQNIVEVGIEAQSFGGFSPVAASNDEVAVSVLGKWNMHESHRHMRNVIVASLLLSRLSQRLGSIREPVDLALFDPAVVWIFHLTRDFAVGVQEV